MIQCEYEGRRKGGGFHKGTPAQGGRKQSDGYLGKRLKKTILAVCGKAYFLPTSIEKN